MKRISLILLFTILSLSSCETDNEEVLPTNTTSDILKAHSWKISSSTKNGVNNLKDCEKDNTFDFKENNVLSLNPGTNKCDKDETSTTEIYALSTDQKTLTFDGDAWTITSITTDKLVLSSNGSIVTYVK